MNRIIVAAALAAGLIAADAAAQTPAGHEPGVEAAVLEAFDRFLLAINAQDLEARAALQTPDGMSYIAVPAQGGGTRIVSRSNAYWVDPANRIEATRIEDRYWSPTVLIRGDMASGFAPYDLLIDGARVQCGADVAQLVRQDGRWLIANIMFTIGRENCEALLPEDESAIRPR